MFKRVLCLCLCVLTVAVSLVSCGKKTPGQEKETADAQSSESPVRSLSDVPDDLTFNGADFTVATRYTCGSVDAEEITGEATPDAVYRRNRLAEEKLKVKINAISSEDTKIGEMVTSIKAGEQIYSAGITHITRMAALVQEGYFINVDDVPYLDLDKPYWAKSVTESLRIGEKSYLFSGDISLQDNSNVWCVYFNKEMMENLGLGDPYGPMAEGRWTMDVYTKDASAAANDLNGDGRWDWSVDQFGAVNLYETLCGFYNGMGQLSVSRDGEDTLAFTLGKDSSVDALMRISKWVTAGQDSYLLDVERVNDSDWDELRNVFVSGRSLFFNQVAGISFLLRDMEQPFGILPMPKADEKQAEYVSSTQEWGQCVYGVTVCAPDTAMAGAVLEYLGGISTDTTRAAFYDVALTRRYTRDKESAASLDILFSNIVIDPGFCYFGLRSTVEEIAKTGVVSSNLQSKEKSVARQILTLEKIIGKLDH